MKAARLKIILSLIFIGQLLSACSGSGAGNSNSSQTNSNQNRTNTPAANDKVEELGLLVNLPVEPDEAVWREDPVTPSDGNQPQYSKKLTAVLKYSGAAVAKVSALIEKSPPLSDSINSETWFPAELIAQSGLSGDSTLKGDSFAATDFYQPPYSEGKITHVEETNYFILELFAK